ncbi:Prefoldin subunit, putative [Angomonas deanei]|uniref:Prefoldin subunit, putative n=1 Tax=Angomonas deanei TaxID=59799 RepID=A0A7G2C8C1_9TRYP|nr:Prefoldin subunit, putative [Angomonas deanei]
MSIPNENAEVLTAAQFYLNCVEINDVQLRQINDTIASYTQLQDTLRAFPLQSRRENVLAPVAGGLAYFKVTMKETNRLLVLLGDGWFVERSAAQALEMVSRRLLFLNREKTVLTREKENLMTKRDLFMDEVDGGREALLRVVQEKEEELSAVAAAGLGDRNNNNKTMKEKESTPVVVETKTEEVKKEAPTTLPSAPKEGIPEAEVAVTYQYH